MSVMRGPVLLEEEPLLAGPYATALLRTVLTGPAMGYEGYELLTCRPKVVKFVYDDTEGSVHTTRVVPFTIEGDAQANV